MSNNICPNRSESAAAAAAAAAATAAAAAAAAEDAQKTRSIDQDPVLSQ